VYKREKFKRDKDGLKEKKKNLDKGRIAMGCSRTEIEIKMRGEKDFVGCSVNGSEKKRNGKVYFVWRRFTATRPWSWWWE
jgi:hypothetical protein